MPQSLSLKLDAYQQRSLVQVNIPPAQAESFPPGPGCGLACAWPHLIPDTSLDGFFNAWRHLTAYRDAVRPRTHPARLAS